MSKFILGTAQFGEGYGISNYNKKSAFDSFNKIKKICDKENIDTIDISDKYFDKNIFNKLTKSFKKKIFKISNLTKKNFKVKIDEVINLENKTYCIMLHNSTILKKSFFIYVLNYLISKKKQNKLEKIGISIYNVEDFWLSLKMFEENLDIIQMPISLIDRRFLIKKILNKIKKNGFEIHARSIFLQGMLLMDQRPNYFNRWKKLFKNWDKEKQIDKINICLNFIKKTKIIKKIVIGSEDEKQLLSIIRNYKKNINYKKIYYYKNFYSKELKLVNPTKWSF